MLRSPPDAHDDHLRKLLDQRTTRADLHSRVPSMSECSVDTPSMYSHAFFSPRPGDKEDDDDRSFMSTSSRPRRVERNRINELAVSMLDLDDDPRSSMASSSTFDDYEEQGEYGDHDDEDDESMPRMSLLGPKMRFHSKAPWELDEGPLMEDDEGEPDTARVVQNHFTVGSSRQASFESNRSTDYGKQSFETSSPYFHGLSHPTQASVSSLSLANGISNPPRAPFAISHVRSHSPALVQSPLLLPTASRSPPESFISSLHDEGNMLTQGRSNSYSPTEEAHPYANPNHARSASSHSYRRGPDAPSSLSFPPVTRSDSSATVTETPFGKMLYRTDTQASEVPVPRSPRSIFQGKEISSPMPLHQNADGFVSDPPEPARGTSFPGWMEKGPTSPNFNLISLEEARAQRTRSSTAQTSSAALPFPEREPDRNSGHSPSNSVASRARARSISAGARAKQAITNIVGAPKPERRDSEPAVVPNPNASSTPGASPGKNVKHKKSGFLRLFNGRDDKSPPPPVPSLSDGFAAFNATQKAPKTPLPRIPVPQLSPTLTVPDNYSTPSGSPKRTPPPLSINTSSPVSRAPSTGVGSRFAERLAPGDAVGVPQSAPANVTEFPALKLRPVSTVFSAHFGNHILSNDSILSPTDLDTPSSTAPSTVVSPTTSVSFSRFHDKPSIVTPSDDQSSVIQALQDQITSAKKAWQRHIWELEGQIRDLKEEVETLRGADKEEYCSSCGRGQASSDHSTSSGETKPLSVVHRPRARTGTGQSRFGSAVQ
ncbi:hypothetical protein BDZ89DRAFT_1115480 [Hymenopellis radicata]|nr:hypothetical protein BDZ89DRAFT_1115480 [Hymenopellis radicata]